MWQLLKMKTKYVWICMCLFVIVVADDNNTANVHKAANGIGNVTIPTECKIDFNQTEVELYRKLTAGTYNKLVYVYFRLLNHTGKLRYEDHGDIFEPLSWIYVSGHQGKSLLSLLYQYEALSIQTMSFGVEHLTIDVTESSNGCLANQPLSVMGLYFRDALLNNFGESVNNTLPSTKNSDESTDKPSKPRICHMTIGKEKRVARFFYTCCHIDQHGDPVCAELVSDSWMQLVAVFIIVTNILVIAFCPFLVPEYYYSDTKGAICYTQEPDTELRPMTILKTSVPVNGGSRSNVVTERLVLKHMPKFSKTLRKLKDESYELDIRKVEFIVKHRDLISESDVPVGIFSTIYNNFARCEIRHDSLMMECCNAEMLSCMGCSVQWYQCLSRLMSTVVLVLVSIPWIIRVIFYAVYERDHYEGRTRAAEARQLETPYQANLSLYISPLHVVFLLCYTFIIIEGMCFGMLHKNVTKNIRVLLRKSFRKMRHSSRVNVMSKMWKLLLKPCTKCGISGILIFPFVWVLVLPVFLVVATFYYIPIVNLTFRLIGSLFANLLPTDVCRARPRNLDIQDKENSEPSSCVKCMSRIRHILLTSFCLLALYSLLLLFVELTQFVVVVAMYTLIGIILNSSFAMQYIPLLLMVAVYGHTTFGGVYKKYMCFNKTVHKHLLDVFKNTFSTAECELMSTDSNTAFKVSPETTDSNGNSNKDFMSVENSNFTWTSRRTVLFVDKHGTPYIRKKFFFQCCDIDHFAAPGALFVNLRNAVFKFLLIISFLLFVGLVVVAFSENFELSATNQTLIALAGGLIPFVLTNFLFREAELPNVEDDDVRFKRCLNDILDDYEETFEVIDFTCPKHRDDDTFTPIEFESAGNSVHEITQNDVTESAGNNVHEMTQNDVTELSSHTSQRSLSGFDTINRFADDSVQLPGEDGERGANEECNGVERMSNGPKQPNEQSLQDIAVEIVSKQTRNYPVSNGSFPGDQTKHDNDSSSTSNTMMVIPALPFEEYDVVVEANREMTARQFFISMI